MCASLRKHAYSNIYKISPPKTQNFQIKNSDIFHTSAQNIDCRYSLDPPRRGGSNEYPQSMFLNRNKKNNVYPCKPQFYYIKVGFKGSKLYRYVFVMVCFSRFRFSVSFAFNFFLSFFSIFKLPLVITQVNVSGQRSHLTTIDSYQNGIILRTVEKNLVKNLLV